MAASPEQLHEMLTYCIEFAKTMLNASGEFYPFGATLNSHGKVEAQGGWDGHEHPNPQDIYRLLGSAFIEGARDGTMHATALASNVNIPAEYSPPSPDGLRVHLETEGYSRFIYVPYLIQQRGFFKKTRHAEFFDPMAVEIPPAMFVGKRDV
jgi:hypothetical protein